MSKWDWIHQSRESWTSDGQPANVKEYIAVGCLQRIATSLERIANLLDPIYQERQQEKERERKEQESRDPVWRRLIDLRDQMVDEAAQGCPSVARASLGRNLHGRFPDIWQWWSYGETGFKGHLIKTAQELEEAVASVDLSLPETIGANQVTKSAVAYRKWMEAKKADN